MKPCKTCDNAIFVAQWGEYKCTESEATVYMGDPEEDIYYEEVDCPYYAKGTPKESKANADYEASMQD